MAETIKRDPQTPTVRSEVPSDLFISISGLIAAGKSTLARKLGELMGLPVYYELEIENEYLGDFYQDMKKYSFNLQVYLLNRRFEQQQKIVWDGQGGIQDRSIYEDSVFARMLHDSGLMETRDFETYMRLFKNMSNFMRSPHVIVHLDINPERALENLKERSRGCESSVSLEYLINLKSAYDDFINEISQKIPVIRIDYSKFHEPEDMAREILREYLCMRHIHTVQADRFV
jgi:deoxyadenosine kinase